jgi:hypothetical protein
MTIPEIVAQLRTELIECVNSDKAMSVEERSFCTTVQNASDEEIIAFWLSLSYLKDHHVSMAVAKQWVKEANDIGEWMSLLKRNTGTQGNN